MLNMTLPPSPKDVIDDPNKDLAFARSGVYQTIGIHQSVAMMAEGKIPTSFWEWQDYPVMNSDGVCAVRTKRKVKYKGSRRQHRIVSYHVIKSRLVLTKHSLDRFYERSGTTPKSPDYFFQEPTGWVKEATASHVSLQKNLIRTDYLFPFKNGAFLGQFFYQRIGQIEEEYRFDEFGAFLETNIDVTTLKQVFFARTFVHESMMTDEQKFICYLIESEQFEDASQRLNDMQIRQSLPIPQTVSITQTYGSNDEIDTAC